MDTIFSGLTEHCHALKPNLVPVLELKNKIKIRSVETEESPSTILHSTIGSFPLNAASQLPQNETLSVSVHRWHDMTLTFYTHTYTYGLFHGKSTTKNTKYF